MPVTISCAVILAIGVGSAVLGETRSYDQAVAEKRAAELAELAKGDPIEMAERQRGGAYVGAGPSEPKQAIDNIELFRAEIMKMRERQKREDRACLTVSRMSEGWTPSDGTVCEEVRTGRSRFARSGASVTGAADGWLVVNIDQNGANRLTERTIFIGDARSARDLVVYQDVMQTAGECSTWDGKTVQFRMWERPL